MNEDEDHYLPLHKACLSKNVVKVGRLLYHYNDSSLDINESDNHHRTPLILAAKVGSEAIIFQLLDYGGVSLNAKDILGNTALFYAADRNKHTIVLHLLAHGADPNIPEGTGATPLIVASKHGYADVVRVILKHGKAWVDHRDRHGATALWYSCYYGNEAVVAMLLKHKARINEANTQQKTPLIAAVEQGHDDCAALLLQNPYTLLDAVDFEGKTALRHACETNASYLVKLLVEKGANPNPRTHIDQTTPLMAASSKGYLDIIKILLDHPDIRVNATDHGDRTALYYACPHPAIVELLLKKGASVSHVDRLGKTATMRAAQIGAVQVLKLFLNHEHNINRIDNDGHTALAYACLGGHDPAVQMLLDNGADPYIADDDDATPIMLAVKFGFCEIVESVAKATTTASIDFRDHQGLTALAHACIRGHSNIVATLLRYLASVWIKDHKGMTPLMHACMHRHPRSVRQLLSVEQDIDALDNAGHTALHYAAMEGAIQCANMLLVHNASPVLANGAGITPLIIASNAGDLDMVKLFVEKSCINHRDEQGKTALYHACDGGFADITLYLLDHGADPMQPCFLGKTPLMLAAWHDNDETLQILLRTPAKYGIDDVSENACTALYYAASQGLATCVELLVQHGANVQLACDTGYANTACLVAAERGFLDVVKMVLCHQPNLMGKTPLHQACSFGHRDVVTFLLSHGADIDATDNQGNTPLILACMRKHHDVAELLMQHKTAATINTANNIGRTGLFYAISNHILETVTLLHNHGASVYTLVQNQTLWEAGYPQYCTQKMIQTLVDDLHLDVNATNAEGKTALFFLSLAFGNKSGSIAFLLSRGANPWIPGPSAMLPIAGAANARVHNLLQNAMNEHQRFFYLEKARKLAHLPLPKNPNHPRNTLPRITWNASSDKVMTNVLDHVIHDMNDDLFRELWGYMKVPWE